MESLPFMRTTLSREVIPRVLCGGAQNVWAPARLGTRALGPAAAPKAHEFKPSRAGIFCFVGGVTPVWVDGRQAEFLPHDILVRPSGVRLLLPARQAAVAWNVSPHELPTGIRVDAMPFGAVARVFQVFPAEDVVRFSPWALLADQRLGEAIEALVEEMGHEPPEQGVVVQGLLLEVLGRLVRAPDFGEEQWVRASSGSEPHPAERPGVVAAAMEHLLANFDQDLSLAGIARSLAVSPSHLSEQFRRGTGHTVMGYLRDLRLAIAVRLLETPLPVKRVAESVGFADPLYFSRVFHRATGQSPTEFRAHAVSELAEGTR
ncbi:MAG: helix-turn-helix transcriptional regulator [Armatimonadetes bacterium]|nr:helix-turn-helix transcriptional regulator [Armatimonadota bacterium]